jgi:hypothetical protein
MSKWKRIDETTPRGKSVLCYWPAVKGVDYKWDAYIGEAWCRFGNWFRTRDSYGSPADNTQDPTHWQPLPPPPTAGE